MVIARKAASFLILFILLVSASGCATGRKQNDLQTQGLRNQVSVLESQLQAKEEEIMNLRDALMKSTEEKARLTKQTGKKRVIAEVKSRPNSKQIQMALQNAGYNPGAIDGRMGSRTKEAIKAFQRDNNLKVDGKVGQRTWSLLKKYLYKKVK
ncbi:MAG: peptidoglycan-binding domain-containing protein [Candidatus Omnitrophota bacterium]